MESGNKVGIAHFETSKFRCHASDGNNEAFLFVTPRSRRFGFIASRTALPPSFFDAFRRITIFRAPWRKAYRTWS